MTPEVTQEVTPEVRRTVVHAERSYSCGPHAFYTLSCGHTVLVPFPPRRTPKTTICMKCSIAATAGSKP